MTRRETIDVGGVPISYLTAGEGGPLLLLLHGTYWSRVWQPVLDGIAAAGLARSRSTTPASAALGENLPWAKLQSRGSPPGWYISSERSGIRAQSWWPATTSVAAWRSR